MILIGLGANLPSTYGEPEDTLAAAMYEMGVRGLSVIKRSRIWLSAPVPVSDQPWYRNAVVAVETEYDIPEVLSVLQAIEADFGRVRGRRNAARLLDLDLLGYNNEVFKDHNIEVPHPRMAGRGFVLLPLQEVCADWVHPVTGESVTGMIKNLPDGQETKPFEKDVA